MESSRSNVKMLCLMEYVNILGVLIINQFKCHVASEMEENY